MNKSIIRFYAIGIGNNEYIISMTLFDEENQEECAYELRSYPMFISSKEKVKSVLLSFIETLVSIENGKIELYITDLGSPKNDCLDKNEISKYIKKCQRN